MKLRKWLENWDMTSLKINIKFLEMEWKPQTEDKNAAWELYIELLTRTTTQYLEPEHGDEATALESIHEIFELTRDIARKHGRDSQNFARIAIIVLNQIIRPFTTKWHKKSVENCFKTKGQCEEFRTELKNLQKVLRTYTGMLADMAGVEDLTDLESIRK